MPRIASRGRGGCGGKTQHSLRIATKSRNPPQTSREESIALWSLDRHLRFSCLLRHPRCRYSRAVTAIRSFRVLVVEDDAALGELFVQVLRERGHDVALAGDVGAAKVLLLGEPFDAVVADLRLPGESGFDLLAWIRRQGMPARVVVASAFTSSDVAAQARRLGASEVLSKPVEPAELVSAIEAAA